MTENEGAQGQKQDSQIYTRRSMLRMLAGLEGTKGAVPFKKTVTQQIMCTYGIFGSIVAFESLGVKTGNTSGDRKDIPNINWKSLAIGIGLIPPIEEGIFRAIPSIVLSRFRSTLWPIGIIDAAAFAGSHNIQTDENGKDYLATERVPVQQFAAGIFWWKLARERGYLHSVLAHTIHNFIFISAGFLGQTLNDKNKNNP